jgi:hypothetical protein
MQHLTRVSTLSALIAALSIPSQADDSLRPLSTDRPDTTESPFTVDRGHWQIETELFSWTRDGGRTAAFSFGETNLKYGIHDSADIQWVLPLWIDEKGGGEGFGDMEIRWKQNLLGNDGGKHALALMPYVKLPTADSDLGNGDLEGGLIIPYATEGPAGWSIGLMAQLDIVSDEDGSGVQPQLLVSAATGHDLTEQTAIFFELAALFTTESGDEHQASFNTGLTWSPTDTLQWDAGIRVGLTAETDDFTPFLGISRKF